MANIVVNREERDAVEKVVWFVAHTRPRCEKKLAQYLDRESVPYTLPTYRSVRKYRGKTLVFEKPLFPNYLFLEISPIDKQKVYQSDYLANLLYVPDQETFERQLSDILTALDTELEVYLAPTIQPGARVRIKSGPLRGMEGWVQQRAGMVRVLLRLDFIGQAAAIKVDATDLELA